MIKTIPTFRKSLLNWYDENKRDLPWRDTRDPYSIWVSEIMLQQTTVDTVIPYYKKFLKRFPKISDVATSNEDELLKMWQGLGYYNRIRNFKKACEVVCAEFGGKVPDKKEILQSLPGLGDYTASAVASIAFGEGEAVLDGNVMRVIARLDNNPGDITKNETRWAMRLRAQELLDTNRAGDYNQAMMEMGAIVCTPKNPKCLICPLNGFCEAYKKGVQDSLPVKSKKAVYVDEKIVSLALVFDNKLLLRKRRTDEIMSGLWEIPQFESGSVQAGQLIDEKSSVELKKIKHAIMLKRIVVQPYVRSCENQKNIFNKGKDEWSWFGFDQLKELALTTISRKILKDAYFQR